MTIEDCIKKLMKIDSLQIATVDKNESPQIRVISARIFNNTTMYFLTAKGKSFVKEMEKSGTADAIRKEKGNIRYEYFYPANSKDTVLLIDSWESQQALDVHHASPMMGKIAELRNKYDLHMKVERYVEDVNGIPKSDDKFIKK